MQIVEDIITVSVALSVLAFLVYVAGLLRLPTHGRPQVPQYNRFGEPIGLAENPGFAETEDETH